MRKFQTDIQGRGPLKWPVVFPASEDKVLRSLWKVSGCHYCQNPHVQMLAKCPKLWQEESEEVENSWVLDRNNSVRPCCYFLRLQLHGFLLYLCRASSPRPWMDCQTGPKKPRSFWCSSATWSSRSRYWQHLRQNATLPPTPHPTATGSMYLHRGEICFFYFSVLWGNSNYFFLLSSNTNTRADQLQMCPLLEVVLFCPQASNTTWFSK